MRRPLINLFPDNKVEKSRTLTALKILGSSHLISSQGLKVWSGWVQGCMEGRKEGRKEGRTVVGCLL